MVCVGGGGWKLAGGVERECGCVEVVYCFCSFIYLCLINLFVARPGVAELLIVVV